MAGYIGSKASVVSSGAERKKTFTITGATTSLTGLNYTVGKVHVFQNGVRLVDGTDYTATNGTTITLTVAAQSGDNVVVISQAAFQVADALLTSGGTMTGDLTVQGAFTSQGIDDNGNATALTIDSDETVLVNRTSAISNNFPINVVAKSDGGIIMMPESNADFEAMRIVNHGLTAAVGSIGVSGTRMHLLNGDTGLRFAGDTNSIFPCTTNGADSNNVIDLGASGNRFKDFYVGGGIYLGGTGAANKLSDYEEGTWTPTLGGTAVYNIQQGIYTKIGNTVTIHFAIRPSSIGTGSSFNIFGIPFPHLAGYSSGLSISFYDGVSTTTVGVTGEVYNSQIALYPKTTAVSSISNTTAFFQNNARLYASATYITAS
ncbi:hypothetical protein N9014_00365 [bacterium]|nr:hypothetical protein [bacterium]